MPYPLSNPPQRAPIAQHAITVSELAFKVSARTMLRWGLELTIVQGKRQPRSSEVWAAALARMPQGDHDVLFAKMPQHFAEEVQALLPAATEFAGGKV
ncbi:hypothetical protein [Thalassobius sp. MITS945101]|uniref:hypothetical protein n=1 Tax=Thalassobius sp. MITS945101 TaxID=3096994 RepID=UPI00399A2281